MSEISHDSVELVDCDELVQIVLDGLENFVLVNQRRKKLNCFFWTIIIAICLILVQINLSKILLTLIFKFNIIEIEQDLFVFCQIPVVTAFGLIGLLDELNAVKVAKVSLVVPFLPV